MADFTWIPFFEELADKLEGYENRQEELIELLRGQGVNSLPDAIDPFTFFSLILKYGTQKRQIIFSEVKNKLALESQIPTGFDGVPNANNQSAWYFGSPEKRSSQDIPALWNVFKQALKGSLDDDAFQGALHVRKVGLPSLTTGLFWVRPQRFFPLNAKTEGALALHNLNTKPASYGEYQSLLTQVQRIWEVKWESPFASLSFEVTQAPAKELCLVGTWKGVAEYADDINQNLQRGMPRAFWWSFPIAPEIQADLTAPFYLYINATNKKITHRYLVESFVSQPGNEGMVSPWPDMTDPGERDRKGADSGKKSEVYKTWFLVKRPIERLKKTLHADRDFESKISGKALVYRGAFGYGYVKTSSHPLTQLAPMSCKNQIFFGPPGTGKTFKLQQLQKEYTDDQISSEEALNNLIEETPLWQLLALVLDELGPSKVPDLIQHTWLNLKLKPEIFKAPRQRAWGTLQAHAHASCENVKVSRRLSPQIFIKDQNSTWSIAEEWEDTFETNDLKQKLMSPGETKLKRYKFITFHQSYGYEEFIEGIRPEAEDGEISYRVKPGVFLQACQEARLHPDKPYALFIDEINRGNIAKIFGELITLIETDKREGCDNELCADLPNKGLEGSANQLCVPHNLDIIGTMNTADRSIALMDTALRRRFEFIEMDADLGQLGDLRIEGQEPIQLSLLLQAINQRIGALLNKDQSIGHAYFLSVHTLDDLREVFAKKIIPLLQEYFFENIEEIKLVLNDQDAHRFFEKASLEFASNIPTHRRQDAYNLTTDWTAETFRQIYSQ